jgi:hypothetical protein
MYYNYTLQKWLDTYVIFAGEHHNWITGGDKKRLLLNNGWVYRGALHTLPVIVAAGALK